VKCTCDRCGSPPWGAVQTVRWKNGSKHDCNKTLTRPSLLRRLRSWLWHEQSNAPHRDIKKRRFRVIHPQHPLYQQEFELVSYRQNWGEDRVWLEEKKDGRLHSLPRNWTDLGDLDPFVAMACGRSFFRVVDLLELAKQVAEWTPDPSGGTVKEKTS